jgi:AcrR family transcriptional regulator
LQILKETVRKNILAAATDEFLHKGFKGASIRSISTASKTSKSNFYHYFQNKEDLFDALCEPVMVKVDSLIDRLIANPLDNEFENGEYQEQFFEFVAKQVNYFLKNFRNEFLLLFDCSTGTRYEPYKDRIINRLEKHFTEHITPNKRQILADNECFVMHIIATNLIEALLEIIRHFNSTEVIEDIVRDYLRYHLKGVSLFF